MKTTSLTENLEFLENKPAVTLMMESKTSKEIRIALKNGQMMKEHQTKFPITVEIFEGAIDFGVKGEILHLKRGDIISLDENVPHDLLAKEDSIVRLSLALADSENRVKEVIENQGS